MTCTEPVIIGVIMEHPLAVNVSNVDDINSEEEEDHEETTPLASSVVRPMVKIHNQRNYLTSQS